MWILRILFGLLLSQFQPVFTTLRSCFLEDQSRTFLFSLLQPVLGSLFPDFLSLILRICRGRRRGLLLINLSARVAFA